MPVTFEGDVLLGLGPAIRPGMDSLRLPHSLPFNSMLCFFGPEHLTPKGASTMEWVTPQHEEIDLNCEVSSYANAEL
jgi:hypothetical protein